MNKKKKIYILYYLKKMSKNIIEFSSNHSFDKEVIEASKTSPVMVDFFATWCGPCKKLSPLLEEAANKYGFKLVVVDVDKNNELSETYNISEIPHIFCFHKGSKVMEFKGYDTNALEKMIFYISKNINKFTGKGTAVGGGEVPKAQNYENKTGDIPEEPPESDDTYEISFRYNNEVFNRRFLCVNTIGQLKSFIRSKIGVSNISLFTPFPRKVYEDDNQILLDAGISKREMLNVGLI